MVSASIRGQPAGYSDRPHPESQVQVLEIEKNPFVKTTHPRECFAVEQGSPAGRTERILCFAKRSHRLASQVVPSVEVAIAGDAGGIDQIRLFRFQEYGRNHPDRSGIPDVDEVLDKVRLGDGIVIKQNYRSLPVCSYCSVESGSKTQISPSKVNSNDIRVARFEQARAPFSWPVIDHDYLGCKRLTCESVQTGRQALAASQGRDVHGRGRQSQTG